MSILFVIFFKEILYKYYWLVKRFFVHLIELKRSFLAIMTKKMICFKIQAMSNVYKIHFAWEGLRRKTEILEQLKERVEVV